MWSAENELRSLTAWGTKLLCSPLVWYANKVYSAVYRINKKYTFFVVTILFIVSDLPITVSLATLLYFLQLLVGLQQTWHCSFLHYEQPTRSKSPGIFFLCGAVHNLGPLWNMVLEPQFRILICVQKYNLSEKKIILFENVSCLLKSLFLTIKQLKKSLEN